MKPIRIHESNLAKHGVLPREVKECFVPGRVRYLKKARRGIYQMITQAFSGRYLEILYEHHLDEITCSTRWMLGSFKSIS